MHLSLSRPEICPSDAFEENCTSLSNKHVGGNDSGYTGQERDVIAKAGKHIKVGTAGVFLHAVSLTLYSMFLEIYLRPSGTELSALGSTLI